jgi:hypothetical protein
MVEESTSPSSTKIQSSDHEEESVDTRARWVQDTLRDVEKHVILRGTFRESKPPQRFLSYEALISSIIDFEPSSFEEATSLEGCHDGGV